jgi:hypothetical protein
MEAQLHSARKHNMQKHETSGERKSNHKSMSPREQSCKSKERPVRPLVVEIPIGNRWRKATLLVVCAAHKQTNNQGSMHFRTGKWEAKQSIIHPE